MARNRYFGALQKVFCFQAFSKNWKKTASVATLWMEWQRLVTKAKVLLTPFDQNKK